MTTEWQLRFEGGGWLKDVLVRRSAPPALLFAAGRHAHDDSPHARADLLRLSERRLAADPERPRRVVRYVRYSVEPRLARYVFDERFVLRELNPPPRFGISSPLLRLLLSGAGDRPEPRWALLVDMVRQWPDEGVAVPGTSGLRTIGRDGLHAVVGDGDDRRVLIAIAQSQREAEEQAARLWPQAWAADIDPWPPWLASSRSDLELPAPDPAGEPLAGFADLPLDLVGIESGDAVLTRSDAGCAVVQQTSRGPLVWSREHTPEEACAIAQEHLELVADALRSVLGPLGI